MRVHLLASALLLAAGLPVSAAAGEAAPRPPQAAEHSYAYDMFEHTLVRPITRVADVPRLLRRVAGRPLEAANVDANDQVRLPSTWWQPRAGYVALTPEQVRRGAGGGVGPVGRWTVTSAKGAGVTPGFQVTDESGQRFIVKFDPPGYPALSTGAEMIGTRLFWAAGYNVPENTLGSFRLEDLAIGPKAHYEDAGGHRHPITRDYLSAMLAHVDRRPDGSYRCSLSRFLEGKPIGPYAYSGRRADDPEDRIPHERRRELRGLWALCAWTNHADSRGANSLDTWVTEGGRSFVRHHLIDFGAVLGAGRDGPKARTTGTEYYVDYGVVTREAATLGLSPFRWEVSAAQPPPSVGQLDAASFDPVSWRPDYPNPAFDDRTARDVRWGARIVAAFTDDMIRAAVQSAEYPDPQAEAYVLRVLIERRDRLARRWLSPQPSAMRAAR